jgi:hypothetical protein
MTQAPEQQERPGPTLGRRAVSGVRVGVMAGAGLMIIGGADAGFHLPLLTTAIGPVAYVLAAHPRSETARARNTLVGQTIAIAMALASLAIFGAWSTPSVAVLHHATLAQVAASALAVAGTIFFLQVSQAHHAPAAATCLLITTGLAHWGRPLVGLVLGLAAVIVLGFATQLWPPVLDQPS